MLEDLTTSAVFENWSVNYDSEKNIVLVRFIKKTLLTTELLNEIQAVIDDMTSNTPYLLITNMEDKITPTIGAYDFYASKERANKVIKEAFVLASPTLKIAANFYYKVKKPIVPSKIFDDEATATYWLLSEGNPNNIPK